jgi:hypothetical protein
LYLNLILASWVAWVAGTEPTSGKAAKAAESVRDAFSLAQETIIEVAESTAEMIDRAGTAVRPDRVEVESGLKFTVSGRCDHGRGSRGSKPDGDFGP